MAGHKVRPAGAVYSATKAAVRMLSEGLRQEVKPYDIRTTVISPGAVMRLLAEAGVGLLYTFEPLVADALRRGTLRVVLEEYAAAVPGFFLYFPSRSQVSPAFRALVDVARELSAGAKPRAR